MFTSTRSITTLVLAFVCILGGIYLLTFHSNGESLGQGLSARRGEAMRLLHERGLLTLELRQKMEKAGTPEQIASLLASGQQAGLEDVPLDAERCFSWLKKICQIGTRASGSEGMKRQQAMLREHFTKLGATVQMQGFDVRHPLNGSRVRMENMLVQWHPEKKERILLAAHYDTRPFPDEDPRNPRGTFVGANDGASGPALLTELAYLVRGYKGHFGIDFVLFDGEEFIFQQRGEYFLGSMYFSTVYRNEPPAYRYKWGVLLDMVADKDLQIYYEVNSLRYARPLVLEIWKTAARLGVKEFRARSRHEIRDDHLPLNQVARIPTCDLIDFDYPRPGLNNSYWHTEQDRPENCSGVSMARVGWVVWEWLKQAR
jgi:hypothetical protein